MELRIECAAITDLMSRGGVRARLVAGFLLSSTVAAALSITPCLGAEGASASDTASPKVIQGGVVKVEVSLNDLRDARLAVSRVRKAAANLYDEVTRQEMTMTSNPNMIGTTVISIPTPSFTGQYLPPRSRWVKASIREISPIMNLFKEDVDVALESNRHVDVSDATSKQLDPLRNELFSSVKSSFETYEQLASLTEGPGYDNRAIADKSKSLDKEMKQLDRTLKKGVSILQKEAKSAKKSQKS